MFDLGTAKCVSCFPCRNLRFHKKGPGPIRPDPFVSLNYANSAKYLIVLTIWLVYEFSLSYQETT